MGFFSRSKSTKKQSTNSQSYDYEEYDCSERLSEYDAALIWGSSGMDEDYTFGYSEDRLRSHLYDD